MMDQDGRNIGEITWNTSTLVDHARSLALRPGGRKLGVDRPLLPWLSWPACKLGLNSCLAGRRVWAEVLRATMVFPLKACLVVKGGHCREETVPTKIHPLVLAGGSDRARFRPYAVLCGVSAQGGIRGSTGAGANLIA